MFLALIASMLVPLALQAQTVEGQAENQALGPDELVFLSAGPTFFYDEYPEGEPAPPPGADWCAGKRIRVGFLLSEIYFGIAVDESALRGPECGNIRWVQTRGFAGFEVARQLGLDYERLTDLQFVDWSAWNRFTLREGSVEFEVEVQPNGSINVARSAS